MEPRTMRRTRARPLTIVADDLTGAGDPGALFAARAPVPVSVGARRAAADAVVRVVDTESRALSGPDAAERMATVAAGGRARHWFKKIDSTLRGPVGAEVDALMRAAGLTTAIVCPALPAQRRVGLGRALASRLGLLADRAEVPAGPRWLVVAGSIHPATRRQVKEARAAGLTVVATAERASGDRGEAIARVVEQAVAAIEREKWDLVVVTGGETAVALWAALGADRVEVVGAPAPGLALGHLRLPGREPLAVLTKAGGFGPPDLIVSLQKKETVA